MRARFAALPAYDRSVRRFWVLAMLLACGDTRRLTPAGEGLRVAFLVMVDADGHPTRFAGITLGQTNTAPLAMQALPGESGAVLLEISADSLSSYDARFDPARIAEVTLELAAPPGAPTAFRDNDELLIRAPIPPGVWQMAFTSDTPALDLGRLTLRFPVAIDHCTNPNAGNLTPFGPQMDIFADHPEISPRTIRNFIPLDSQHLLVQTNLALYLVERGKGIVDETVVGLDSPGSRFHLPQFLPGGILDDVAIDPREGPRRRVLIAVHVGDDRGIEHDGYALQLSLSADGLRWVGTATTSPGYRYRSVAIDGQGTAMILADEGLTLLDDQPGWRRLTLPASTGYDESRKIIATGNPDIPFMMGTRRRIHIYRRGTDDFDTHAVEGSTEQSIHFRGFSADPEPIFDGWAAGTDGAIFRRTPLRWRPVLLALPPRYALCASTDRPPFALVRNGEAIVVAGQYAYLAISDCSAVVVIRRMDECASLLTDSGPAQNVMGGYVSLAVFNGEIFAAGHEGRLMVAPIGP